MTRVIDRIRKHYEANSKRSLDVPEWGCTIYAAPVTFADWRRVKSYSKDDEDAGIVSIIIEKCRDKDGNAIFDDDAETRATLEGKAAAHVVSRVFSWLIETPDMESEKNA